MSDTTEIFENAVDSLEHAVAHYLVRDEHDTAIKHAILTLYHCIELFLKERLARVHPILVYRNIDKAINDSSFTVGLKDAIMRLANLKIGLSRDHITVIEDLQRRRNRIEHHRFDLDADHSSAVGQAIKFLLEFLPEHLGVELRDLILEEDTYRELIEASHSYHERVSRARREASAKGETTACCPCCREDTVAVEDSGLFYCYFCEQTVELEECPGCFELVSVDELNGLGMCEKCESEASHHF